MAKRKKNGNTAAAPQMAYEGPREKRVNVGIEEAENGFIVRSSCEGIGNKPYESKTHIAATHPEAMRIANTTIGSIGKKVKGKKNGRKKIAVSKG